MIAEQLLVIDRPREFAGKNEHLGRWGDYPALIVADYRLARGELGSVVVARLREELGLPIPAVLISGDLSVTAQRAVHTSGCEVLVKPVLPGELKGVR